jgi:hypothetical protein
MGFRREYNHDRPHQSLGMAVPASRFVPVREQIRDELGLDIPAELLDTRPGPTPVTPEPEAHEADCGEVADDRRQGFLTGDEHWLGGQAIELDRTVSPSGNVKVGPQQFWIGPAHAGRRLGLRMDTTTVDLSLDGVHLKTVPSRQTTVSLTRLRSAGARRPDRRHDAPRHCAAPSTARMGSHRAWRSRSTVS